MWNILENLDHNIVKPVPSLFTFNIKDNRIKNIPGVVANDNSGIGTARASLAAAGYSTS